jgi:hypothetical protein
MVKCDAGGESMERAERAEKHDAKIHSRAEESRRFAAHLFLK